MVIFKQYENIFRAPSFVPTLKTPPVDPTISSDYPPVRQIGAMLALLHV